MITVRFPFSYKAARGIFTCEVEKVKPDIEEAYFESDYCTYELDELEKQIELIQSNELPIETAIDAEEETRPMEELMKMIKTRIVDIIEVIDNID